MLKMEMTQNITKQILENEQVGKKDSCKWPFSFVEIFKLRDLSGPSFSLGGNI
jgi:hypothetical protein